MCFAVDFVLLWGWYSISLFTFGGVWVLTVGAWVPMVLMLDFGFDGMFLDYVFFGD